MMKPGRLCTRPGGKVDKVINVASQIANISVNPSQKSKRKQTNKAIAEARYRDTHLFILLIIPLEGSYLQSTDHLSNIPHWNWHPTSIVIFKTLFNLSVLPSQSLTCSCLSNTCFFFLNEEKRLLSNVGYLVWCSS